MAAESAVAWVKEMTNPLRFRNLNSSHMTISTHIHYFYIKKKLDEIFFLRFLWWRDSENQQKLNEYIYSRNLFK